MFVEAIFKSTFSFSYVLFATAFALNHVNKVFRVAGNVVSNGAGSACGVECVRSESVGCAGARRTITATLTRISGVCVVFFFF